MTSLLYIMKKLLQDVFSNNLYHFQDYLWTRARHKPGSVSDNHLSRHTVAGMLQRPTFRAAAGNCPAKAVRPFWSCSGWGLHETYVTIHPRELLPHDFTLTAKAAVCFCCTFPIVTYAGRYPASSPCGARTFLTPRERRAIVCLTQANVKFTKCMDLCSPQPL